MFHKNFGGQSRRPIAKKLRNRLIMFGFGHCLPQSLVYPKKTQAHNNKNAYSERNETHYEVSKRHREKTGNNRSNMSLLTEKTENSLKPKLVTFFLKEQ